MSTVRWEYRTERPHECVGVMRKDGSDAYLNELGAAGWELVGVASPSAQGGGFSGGAGALIFRRQVDAWTDTC